MRTLLVLALVVGAAAAWAQEALMINGYSYVPLRAVSETFGASVAYNSATKGISLSLQYQKIDMAVGRPVAVVSGKPQTLDATPVLIAGVTYVPVRFIAVTFGTQVIWVQETRQVKIIHPGSGKKVMLIVKDGPGKPTKTTIHRGGKPGAKGSGSGGGKGHGKGKGKH